MSTKKLSLHAPRGGAKKPARGPGPGRSTRYSAPRDNPYAACPPRNQYPGRTVNYKKKDAEVAGCGTGRVAKKPTGAKAEATYALRDLKTGKIHYVPKRVLRDLKYNRGSDAILGSSAKPHPRKKPAPKTPDAGGRCHKKNGQFAKCR